MGGMWPLCCDAESVGGIIYGERMREVGRDSRERHGQISMGEMCGRGRGTDGLGPNVGCLLLCDCMGDARPALISNDLHNDR